MTLDHGRATRSTIAVLLLLLLTAPSLGSPPPVFTDASFEDAKAETAKRGKLLILDATAVWCAPCKRMDKTTWIDEKVVSWIESHGVAVQFDVDREKALARKLAIQAMPTIIVFKDGTEFDRVVGLKTSEQLLGWLNGVLEGRRDIDRLRSAAGDRMDESGEVDIRARLDLARTLARTGELDEAAGEYAWLWDNMLRFQRSMYGVRLSFMVADMQRLAARHAPARKVFLGLRDREAAVMAEGKATRETVSDWIHLNRVVGDDQATLSWYERSRNDPEAATLVDLVADDIFRMLIQRGRWDDAGRVHRDPVGDARQQVEMARMDERLEIPEAQRKQILESTRRLTRRHLSQLYAASLAARREMQAEQVAALLLGAQDDELARFALIEQALEAGQPRAIHREWLDEAGRLGKPNDALAKRLTTALASHP